MYSDIVFTSSYSSQIGSIAALIKKYRNLKIYDDYKRILVIQIKTKNDKDCKYSFFSKYSNILKEYKIEYKILRINSFAKRLVLYFGIFIIRFYLNQNKLNLWEPRPGWIDSLFHSKFLKLPKLIKNLEVNYYGDGFLCLSKSMPFWLNANKSINNYQINTRSKFFFHYDLEKVSRIDNYPKNYIKVEPKLILDLFNRIIDFDRNKIRTIQKSDLNKFKNLEKLIIFPLTTFTETKRSSLYNEINLYIEYFKKNLKNKDNLILIKSHPNGSPIKDQLVKKELYKLNYNLINIKDIEDLINLEIPLEMIPLEILCLKINIFLKIPFSKITIPLISNVTISTLKLYPEINHLKPFGKKLISKYIKEIFIKKRLEQEEIMIKKLN